MPDETFLVKREAHLVRNDKQQDPNDASRMTSDEDRSSSVSAVGVEALMNNAGEGNSAKR